MFRGNTFLRNVLLATAMLSVSGAALAAARQNADMPPPVHEVPVAELSSYEADATAVMGIDPIVTGPVSPEFKAKQAALGCDTAVWPHIPSACYPR